VHLIKKIGEAFFDYVFTSVRKGVPNGQLIKITGGGGFATTPLHLLPPPPPPPLLTTTVTAGLVTST